MSLSFRSENLSPAPFIPFLFLSGRISMTAFDVYLPETRCTPMVQAVETSIDSVDRAESNSMEMGWLSSCWKGFSYLGWSEWPKMSTRKGEVDSLATQSVFSQGTFEHSDPRSCLSLFPYWWCYTKLAWPFDGEYEGGRKLEKLKKKNT